MDKTLLYLTMVVVIIFSTLYLLDKKNDAEHKEIMTNSIKDLYDHALTSAQSDSSQIYVINQIMNELNPPAK